MGRKNQGLDWMEVLLIAALIVVFVILVYVTLGPMLTG